MCIFKNTSNSFFIACVLVLFFFWVVPFSYGLISCLIICKSTLEEGGGGNVGLLKGKLACILSRMKTNEELQLVVSPLSCLFSCLVLFLFNMPPLDLRSLPLVHREKFVYAASIPHFQVPFKHIATFHCFRGYIVTIMSKIMGTDVLRVVNQYQQLNVMSFAKLQISERNLTSVQVVSAAHGSLTLSRWCTFIFLISFIVWFAVADLSVYNLLSRML